MPKNAPTYDFPLHHGRLSLSFAGTIGDRGSLQTERLASPEALAAWLKAAEVTSAPLAITPRVYRRALQLREAIARAATRAAAGKKLDATDITQINGFAKAGASRIALDPKTLTIVDAVRDPVAAAFGRIARDAIELLGSSDERSRLRTCGLTTCGSIFLTPAGRRERRWCSMARCGNRAKVSAFRDRTQRA
jgi:predicted RNA-binding Zn ribbon-like protein